MMSIGLMVLFIFPKKWSIMLLILFFTFVGFWTSISVSKRTSSLEFLHNKNVQVLARVLQPPIHKRNKQELILEIHQVAIEDRTLTISERALGNIYFYEDFSSEGKIVKEGDIIRFVGKIRMPKGKRNPGGFDYSLYLKGKKIYSTITVIPETIIIEDYSLASIPRLIYGVKNRVENIIDMNLPENHRHLLKGILFGQKELDEGVRDDFVRSGIAHILAVSGLHVGIVVGLTRYLSKVLRLNRVLDASLLTIILTCYIIMTGAAASVLRASMMAWIYLLSNFFNKKYDGISALSLSGFIILIPNPLLLFSASFQLSFLAALSIIVFYPVLMENYFQRMGYIPSSIRATLAVTIAAQIGTIPVSLYHFHMISMVSIFANLLIIPIMGILFSISILGILLYPIIPLVGSYFFFLSGLIFEWILRMAGSFSSLPMATIALPPFSWMGIAFYVLLFLIFGRYLPIEMKKVRMAFLVALMLIFIVKGSSAYILKPLRVTFLDVNQGDSILIQTPRNKNLLIDGGGYPSYQRPPRRIAEEVLIPALYAKGIRKLDFVMVSHPHDDHIKGIQELIGVFPIDTIGIFDSEVEEVSEFIEYAKNNNIQVEGLAEGSRISIEKNLELEIISPSSTFSIENPQKDHNNSSLVARLNYQQRSFLFTGDIEKETEAQLVSQGKNIRCDVLKVPHHGSSSSSGKEFIDQVDPAICIISVGESNNFGHPDSRVLEALENDALKVFRTDRDGAIELRSNGYWIKAKPYVTLGVDN